MKKILAFILCIVFLAAALPPATAEDTAAEETAWLKAWLCGPHYGYRGDITALLLSNDPEQDKKTEAEIAENIRFVPFYSETGLYAAAEDGAAGERAEITYLSGDRSCISLRLKEPGKYMVFDTAYYYLDHSVPAQAALRAELDDAVTLNTKEKETQMARGLHDWIAQRFSPAVSGETELADLPGGDPMNALITGYAAEEAYDRLFDMLLASAGLCSVLISGTAGGQEGTWCLSRLDGKWVRTDMSMDDMNDKKSNAYFAKDEKTFEKDHAASAADEAFTDRMIRGNGFEALLAGELPASMFHVNLLIGEWAFLISEGPAYTVGDSATVSFRCLTNNDPAREIQKPVEQFLEEMVCWYSWDEENKWYNDDCHTLDSEPEIEEKPSVSELVTVEEINEDKTRFTLTFHRPGRYVLYYRGGGSAQFYLISPEATSLAAAAAEMDQAVEKAKEAPTETAAAKIIFQWVRSHVKYNKPAYQWMQTGNASKVTERDVKTAWEAFGGLIYGKVVCEGYASLYHMMMQQAGLTDFEIEGFTGQEDNGHAWNLNRLDGVWSFTDATWNRFAWTGEKMNKDHEANLSAFFDWILFGDVMSVLAAQVKGEHKPLSAIPVQLKYLPKTAEGYGFPEKPEKFMDVDLKQEDGVIMLKLSQKARILINEDLKNRGDPLADWERTSPVAKEYSVKKKLKRFQVELRTDPDLPFVKKAASQWILINYENGQILKTVRRTVIPDKAGTYAGYNPRYHYFEYDEEMKPAAVGWYMVSPSRDSLEFRVFFDADGNVTSYEARYESSLDKIKSIWEGTPENALTVLNGKEVEDPSQVDPKVWEPVWFE